MATIALIKSLLWCVRLILTIYAFHYLFFSIFSIRRAPHYPVHKPVKRFALVVPARNEAGVIGNLIESLLHQDYPREFFDIFVIPNNCSDNTRDIAIAAGAQVIDCTVPTRSKGEVLAFALNRLLESSSSDNPLGDGVVIGAYDDFIIFDADNVVDPGFLRVMNNAACTGIRVAQGFRDSKNPRDTILSSCSSIYYLTINRFINHAKSAAGLSAMINGTGFMVDVQWLREIGGWHTYTLTEDIEFTTQCVLLGEKVAWVPDARTYDEQPQSFAQSWNQRSRWSSGNLQGFSLYGRRLIRAMFHPRGLMSFDLTMNFIAPIMHLLYIVSVLVQFGLELVALRGNVFPGNDTFYSLFLSLPGSYLGTTVIAILVILMEHKNIRIMLKGILAYGLFIYSWVPINFLSLFRTSREWKEIRHTSKTRIHDLAPMQVKSKSPAVSAEIDSSTDE